ncbi:MAG: transglycosylase domain-containing protein [Eubacteriales bacterium]|nr:transglycosylase domain-containing protein [Eubacteriales bacterium]
MKNRSSKGKKVLFIVICVILSLIITAAIVFSAIYFSAKLDDDKIVAEKATLKILGSDGAEIDCEAFNRYVTYENINSNIINAFVSLEDKRFFTHNGVDYYRLAGATIKNVKYGYFKEGGSTITQQLAKNTQLNSEKTFTRKIKEMKLAHDIEKKYSKEEILEMYLNAIYYGNGIYGIDSACKNYFDKSPAEVSVAESAILAGIVKNPSKYSPINNKDKALERMKLVCGLMKTQNYINEEEYEEALRYEYVKPSDNGINPYINAALSEACEILGVNEKNLLKSKYVIECYYDEKLQNIVENLASSDDFSVNTYGGKAALSSVVLCDNASGGVIACYSSDGINPIAFRRSPGSCIKPVAVYAPALERKAITEATVFNDEKTVFDGYSPSNYKDIYYGKVDVETAVKKSINTVAVNIFRETGKEYCVNKAIEAGISVDKNDLNLSFALGGMTYGVTTKEMCQAYTCFANGGMKRKIGLIRTIKNVEGKIIYKNNEESEKAVFSKETSYIITDLLQKTAQNGTARKLSEVKSTEVAAKTGTVSGGVGNTDAWCMSYSPDYTLCVWYGGADNTDEENIAVTGGGIPALLSANVYKYLPIRNEKFDIPDSVAEVEIDLYARNETDKLYLANENTPYEYKKSYVFSENNVPKEVSPYFNNLSADFSAEKLPDGGVKLRFCVIYPNSYVITRTDLSDGSVVEIYRNENLPLENYYGFEEFTDEQAENGKIYLYNLKIFYASDISANQSVTVIT